jgi:hypothetical protein
LRPHRNPIAHRASDELLHQIFIRTKGQALFNWILGEIGFFKIWVSKLFPFNRKLLTIF